MSISAALQLRGNASTTCSSLSSHNFVGLLGKAQSRVAGVSCSIPYQGLFVVALSVPLSHHYISGNHTSMPVFQEIIQIGRLNPVISTYTASHVQAVAKQVEDMPFKDSSELVDHRKHCVKGSAKGSQSSITPKSTDCNTKKSRVAWNKGRFLSEEVKERIRTRTRQAMEDPKIRERLRKAREGSSQSFETKLKIKSGVLSFWELKREAKQMQVWCVREWEELIADAARRGSERDVAYQWDSYVIIMGELRNAYKKVQSQKARTGRKSADHKRKISEAIRAKWADPNYSKRVRRGRAVSLSNQGDWSLDRVLDSNRVEKFSSLDRSLDRVLDSNRVEKFSSLDRSLESSPVKKFSSLDAGMVVTKKQPSSVSIVNMSGQSYKDPLTHHKLEKLKQMRSSRHLEEDRKRKDMMERAWVLMEEAKRAADALESIKLKDKNAVASLVETRRLLAEAERCFEYAGVSMDRLG